MFSRIDAATHAVSAERNNIGIHGAGRISHIRPFPKIRQIELHHSPSASGARWTQWLIDNNNFTPKTRNHFLCTLFHFSLHDFHLNSIIHNKWPRSFVVCCHYPEKTDDPTWNALCQQFTGARVCLAASPPINISKTESQKYATVICVYENM